MGQLFSLPTNQAPRKVAKMARTTALTKLVANYSDVASIKQDIEKQCKGRVIRHGTKFYFVEKSDATLIKLRYGEREQRRPRKS